MYWQQKPVIPHNIESVEELRLILLLQALWAMLNTMRKLRKRIEHTL